MRTVRLSLTLTSEFPLPLTRISASRVCSKKANKSPEPLTVCSTLLDSPSNTTLPEPLIRLEMSSASRPTSILPEPEMLKSMSSTFMMLVLVMMPEPLMLSERTLGMVMKMVNSSMSRTQRSKSISQIPFRTSLSSSAMMFDSPSTVTLKLSPCVMMTSAEMSRSTPVKSGKFKSRDTVLPLPRTHGPMPSSKSKSQENCVKVSARPTVQNKILFITVRCLITEKNGLFLTRTSRNPLR